MFMKGKKGIILGLANHRSIAWGVFQSLREQGAEVSLTYLNERMKGNMDALLEKHDITDVDTYECDVTKQETIDKAFQDCGEKLGQIDFVVHCLAFANKDELKPDEFINTSREGFALANDVSAYSLVAIAKAAKPFLSDDAAITCLSYLGADQVCNAYNVMGVAKAALQCSVRYLAAEMGQYGVRVNAISAGPVNTLAARGISGFTDMMTVQKKMSSLRRANTIEEIGDAVMFLSSRLSRGITSETIYVDCGFHNIGIGPKEAYNLDPVNN